MTGSAYRWDERVTLFFLDDKSNEDSNNYVPASVLLRLGASVAEADGQVDEKELAFITNHLEGQFNLADAESKRLERLQYLLLHSRTGDNTISKMLAKRLPREHRLLVGEFLVGVAAVDEVITKDEIKALRKAYKLLDLEVEDLDKLIARHVGRETDDASAPDNAELRLDMQAISRIMSETRQVAGILRDAMAVDDEPEEPSADSTATAVTKASVRGPVMCFNFIYSRRLRKFDTNVSFLGEDRGSREQKRPRSSFFHARLAARQAKKKRRGSR